MIIGIGTDLVDIRRIEKSLKSSGKKFESRLFTLSEQEAAYAKKGKARAAYYAKRFAAKEAFAKALGTGIGTSVSFKDLEILNLDSGQPFISLSAKIKKLLRTHYKLKKLPQVHVSLSDDYPYAQAFVIISRA